MFITEIKNKTDLGLFKIWGYVDLGLFKIGGYVDLGLLKTKGANCAFSFIRIFLSVQFLLK